MRKCVLIEMDDTGMVSVGMSEKEDMEPPPEGYDMQPADNLQAALAMAKDMLGKPEGEMEAEAQAQEDFSMGLKKVRGPGY